VNISQGPDAETHAALEQAHALRTPQLNRFHPDGMSYVFHRAGPNGIEKRFHGVNIQQDKQGAQGVQLLWKFIVYGCMRFII
jgi:hypothetical protein